MSFSGKRAVCSLVDQFRYYLLIGRIKISAVLKRQRFEDCKSDKTESSVLKRQWLDVYDKKEE